MNMMIIGEAIDAKTITRKDDQFYIVKTKS